MQRRMIEGAQRYALANNSDPFALSRALSHLANGVAGYRHLPNGTREDAFYDATPVTEERQITSAVDGEVVKYNVIAFNNVRVP
jgi:hypothetical protein